MKTIMGNKFFLLKYLMVVTLLFSEAPAFMQTTLHVLTRHIEKEFDFYPSDKLIVAAERGVVHIRKSNDGKVKINLRIVAKNQDQDVARKELDYIQYSMTKAGKEVVLTNSILLPSKIKSEDISSIIRAEYEIFIPDKSNISIKNSFGILQIHTLDVSMDADLEYCDISLSQITGNIKLEVNVGDIQCMNSLVNATFNTNYANISLNNVSGNLTLTTQNGSLHANLNGNLSLLDIRANRTEIMLVNRECKPYKLSLKSDYALVNISQACYGLNNGVLISQPVPGKEHYSIESRPSDAERTIRIISSSGNIMLN
jgi:phage gp45-like